MNRCQTFTYNAGPTSPSLTEPQHTSASCQCRCERTVSFTLVAAALFGTLAQPKFCVDYCYRPTTILNMARPPAQTKRCPKNVRPKQPPANDEKSTGTEEPGKAKPPQTTETTAVSSTHLESASESRRPMPATSCLQGKEQESTHTREVRG